MAKKDFIILYGNKFPCLNISESVGLRGSNKVGDVMLIQAIFQYIGRDENTVKSKLGLTKVADLPEVTGILDGKTLRAINRYQQKNIGKLMKIDGIFHPALYENRNLRTKVSSRLMAITQLHFDLIEAALFRGNDDHLTAIPQMFPQIQPFIR